MRKALLIIILITSAFLAFVPGAPGKTNGTNIFCGLPIFPGSEKVLLTEGDTPVMGIYRNKGSVDINFNYYESYLLANGWKKPRISEEVSNSMDLAIIIMTKNNSQWYICFYTDQDNYTCALLISGKE